MSTKNSAKKQLSRFFSNKNVDLLYTSIVEALEEMHYFKIQNDDFKPLLRQAMQKVANSTPSNKHSLSRLV